jgi:hypothetical protein
MEKARNKTRSGAAVKAWAWRCMCRWHNYEEMGGEGTKAAEAHRHLATAELIDA